MHKFIPDLNTPCHDIIQRGWFCTSTLPGLVAVGAVDLAIWPVCYTHRIQKSAQIFASLCMRLKGQCHEIFCFWFFYESVSPQPQRIPLVPFRIFSKIRGNICKSRCTTGVKDTGGKFATGLNNTGGKFCHQFPLCC